MMDKQAASSSNTSNNATSTKTATIIPFPEHRIVAVRNHSEESLTDNLIEHRLNLVNTVTDDLMNMLYAHLTNSGLNVDETDDDFQRDWCFLYEGFRSLLFRAYGIEHEFHPFIDENVDIDTDEGLVNLKPSTANTPEPPMAA